MTITAQRRASVGALALSGGMTWRQRGIALLLLLAMSMVALMAFASPARADTADEDDPLESLSFYKAASSMTSFWSSVQAPPGDEELNDKGVSGGFGDAWMPYIGGDAGTAGSLLGYLDPKFSFSPDWLAAKFSGSSDAIGYDSVSYPPGLRTYVQFGATLKGMGLDHTSTGLSLSIMEMVGGGLMILLYIMAGFIEILFVVVIAALKLLNPFQLLYLGVYAVNPTFAQGMVGGGSFAGMPPALIGLASFIRDWYAILSGISWAIILPIFLAVLIMGLLLFKNMNKGGAIKRFTIRAVFITLGIPLIGSMYTATLNSFDKIDGSVGAGATRVVMSTFVDFEGWMYTSRLAVPAGATIVWNGDKDEPTASSQMNVRRTTLMINTQTFRLPPTVALLAENTSSSSWSAAVIAANENGVGANTYLQTTAMLTKYMVKDLTPASSLESEMKATMSNTAPETRAFFQDVIKEEPVEVREMGSIGTNPLVFVEGGRGLRAFYGGGPSSYTVQFSSDVDANCIATATSPGNAIRVGTSARACNLSPLAAYNYLNTDFGPTSMVMYSSGNVQSEATRSVHTAVNLVGSGPMPVIYWVNAAVLLLSFITIGIAYAFSMLFATIKRTIQGISAIPFALIGSLAGIAKVIVYFVAAILQILVTVFAYKFIQEFLISLPQIIEMPLAAALGTFGSDTGTWGFVAFLISGTGIGLAMGIISIIAILAFTVMALRLRGSLVKAIEEAVEKIVNKFIEVQPGSGGKGGGMMPALAAGAAGGLGAAAAGRMMNNSGGASKTAAVAPATAGQGPGTPGTGGGGAPPAPGGVPGAPGHIGGTNGHPGNGTTPPGGPGGGGGTGRGTGPAGIAPASSNSEGPTGPGLSPNPSATDVGKPNPAAGPAPSKKESVGNVANTTMAGASKGGLIGAGIGAAAGVTAEGVRHAEHKKNSRKSSLDGPPSTKGAQMADSVQQIGSIAAMGKGGGAGGAAKSVPKGPVVPPK